MSRLAVMPMIFAIGCAPAFDPDRVPDDGTFGERVVTLMCKRLAYQADRSDVSGATYRDACRGGDLPDHPAATVAAIHGDRDRLIAAIDKVVPADTTGALQTYLTQAEILGMYDDDTMAKTTASLGDLLAEMGGDRAAMDALARLGGHEGYRSPGVAIGPNGPFLHATNIDAVLDTILPEFVDGGRLEGEWNAVTTSMAATFGDASIDPEPPAERTSSLLYDLFLTERAGLSEAKPLWIVNRDRRGVARVALDAGAVPAPFADVDGDKLADVDETGRYVDTTGMRLAMAPPFPVAGDGSTRDADGRALDPNGQPIFEYIDLGKTVMGAMAHDNVALLEPAHSTALDFVRGASRLLGDRTPATKTFDNGATLAYAGYDTTDAPALDLAYAYTQLLRDPNTRDMLALTLQLFSPAHVSTTARLAKNAIEIARLGDAHVEAQILENAPLWDDMRSIIARIMAKPQLVKDILEAMKRPETKQLATRFREFMTYTDRFDIDPTTQALVGNYTTQVDRAMPDTGFNRSLFQRLLMVINDSQVGQCNKANAQVKDPILHVPVATYQRCAMFQIENLAVFYLQAIVYAKDATGKIICENTAGEFAATQAKPTAAECATIGAGWRPRPKADFNYNWGAVVSTLINAQGGDQFVENQAGIVGFRTHPTPQALNRVLFLPVTPQTIQDTSDPIVDKDGDLMNVQHVGTLPVWEKNNFYDQIRPLAQAFADAGEEKIFVDLMSVLHKHWSSAASTSTQHTGPAGANYTFGSNGKSYEPYIIEVLDGDIWPALTETAPELTAITANGKSFATIITNSAKFVVSPLPGLANRTGVATSTTSDGKPVPVLSPWQLLADAYNHKRDRLRALGPDEAKLWTDSTTELVDILYLVEKVGTTWAFKNPRTPAITSAITSWLVDRLVAHEAAGDRIAWLSTELPADMRDKLTHPVFASLVDLLDGMARLDGPRQVLGALLAEVFDETAHPDWFDTLRVGNADLVQLARDDDDLIPLGHMVGHVLSPEKNFLAVQLSFLNRLHAVDAQHVLRDITARLFEPYDLVGDPGVPTISAIVDGVGDVDRLAPSTEPAWSGADYQGTFVTVGAFLREQMYGLPRFIAIVKGRELP